MKMKIVFFAGAVMFAALYPVRAQDANAPKIYVEFCNSAGSGVLRLAKDSGAQVTLDVDSALRITNQDTGWTITINDKKPDKPEIKLRELGGCCETVVITATHSEKRKYGLRINIVEDTAVNAAECAWTSVFNTLRARVGVMYGIVDDKLQDSVTDVTISSVIGLRKRLDEKERKEKKEGKEEEKKIFGLESLQRNQQLRASTRAFVPLPDADVATKKADYLTSPQFSDFRLLAYTLYSAVELPDPTKFDESKIGQRAAATDLADAYKNAQMAHDLEVGLIWRFDDIFFGKINNPDSAFSLRIGGGVSTFDPKTLKVPGDDESGMVSVPGHSPWFWDFAFRFESNYESWGSGQSIRGFVEVGMAWYYPYGMDERNRYILSAGVSLPGLQAGDKAAIFAFIKLDIPVEGTMTDHRIGILTDINLAKLFKSGS